MNCFTTLCSGFWSDHFISVTAEKLLAGSDQLSTWWRRHSRMGCSSALQRGYTHGDWSTREVRGSLWGFAPRVNLRAFKCQAPGLLVLRNVWTKSQITGVSSILPVSRPLDTVQGFVSGSADLFTCHFLNSATESIRRNLNTVEVHFYVRRRI